MRRTDLSIEKVGEQLPIGVNDTLGQASRSGGEIYTTPVVWLDVDFRKRRGVLRAAPVAERNGGRMFRLGSKDEQKLHASVC